MPRRRCLCGCGRLVTGSRCPESRHQQRAKYQGDWPATSRAAIEAHVALYGWNCPGFDDWHSPHPSQDLVLDHPTRQVMCRQVNSAKRSRGYG